MGVGGAGQHLAPEGAELAGALGEGDDLGGADEGEVQRVEEEDDVLAAQVGQGDVDELPVDDGLGLEGRGGLARLEGSHLGPGERRQRTEERKQGSKTSRQRLLLR